MKKFKVEGLNNDLDNQVWILNMKKTISDSELEKYYSVLIDTNEGLDFMKKIIQENLTKEETAGADVALCENLYLLKSSVKTNQYEAIKINNKLFLYAIGKSGYSSNCLTLAFLAFDLTI